MPGNYPFDRSSRRSSVLAGDGSTTVFGPSAFKIFDIDDVELWRKDAGESKFSLYDEATIAKTGSGFSTFTITFDEAPPETTSFYYKGRRVHERSTAISKAQRLDVQALDGELTKIGTILQEHDTALSDAIRVEPGITPPVLTEALEEGDMLIAGPNGTLIPTTPEAVAGVSGDMLMNMTWTPEFHGAAPVKLKYMLSEDIPIWAFTDEGTQIELGDESDEDHNSAIVDKALEACGYDTAKIRGLQFQVGKLRLRAGQHGVPNGVRVKGYGAVERLDRDFTSIQIVGLGDLWRLQGDIDVASGQHYFGGEFTHIKYLGDDTQPYGESEDVGDVISFRTLDGDDVAPQDNCLIQWNIFRHPPRHGIYCERGGLPITWGNNKFRECGGSGLYMDGGFNVQSAHFLDFSGDRCIGGVIKLVNIPDTGNILITNLKSEMQKNTHYGNANSQLVAVYIEDCDEGATIGITGATHISAVVEGGYRRRTGDLVSITGSNIPDLRWDDCHIRLNFGGQTDDPGDPVAYYVRTPWSTYGTKSGRIHASETFVEKIHDDQGFKTFGELEAYMARSVENVGFQLAGVTPALSLYETDADANKKAWLISASGGVMQWRVVTDAGVATTFLNVNREASGAARNIQSTIPMRDGPATIAELQANVAPWNAASNPNCEVIVSDGTSAHGRKAQSLDITTPGTWRWHYTYDLTAV